MVGLCPGFFQFTLHVELLTFPPRMSDLNIYDHIFFDLLISSQAVSDFLFSKYSVNQGIQVIQVRHVIHLIHVIHEIHIIQVTGVIHSGLLADAKQVIVCNFTAQFIIA